MQFKILVLKKEDLKFSECCPLNFNLKKMAWDDEECTLLTYLNLIDKINISKKEFQSLP